MAKKKARRKVRRKKELTWEEALEISFKELGPILDKLRDYDLGKVSEEELKELEEKD